MTVDLHNQFVGNVTCKLDARLQRKDKEVALVPKVELRAG